MPDPIEGDSGTEKVGYILLRLYCRRLPEELRAPYYELWASELEEHFQVEPHLLNKIFWALWFPVVIFSAGLRIARTLNPEAFPATWVRTSNREVLAQIA